MPEMYLFHFLRRRDLPGCSALVEAIPTNSQSYFYKPWDWVLCPGCPQYPCSRQTTKRCLQQFAQSQGRREWADARHRRVSSLKTVSRGSAVAILRKVGWELRRSKTFVGCTHRRRALGQALGGTFHTQLAQNEGNSQPQNVYRAQSRPSTTMFQLVSCVVSPGQRRGKISNQDEANAAGNPRSRAPLFRSPSLGIFPALNGSGDGGTKISTDAMKKKRVDG